MLDGVSQILRPMDHFWDDNLTSDGVSLLLMIFDDFWLGQYNVTCGQFNANDFQPILWGQLTTE